jgi:hypothetical protein
LSKLSSLGAERSEAHCTTWKFCRDFSKVDIGQYGCGESRKCYQQQGKHHDAGHGPDEAKIKERKKEGKD